jgi:hypothetical protein
MGDFIFRGPELYEYLKVRKPQSSKKMWPGILCCCHPILVQAVPISPSILTPAHTDPPFL